MLSRPQRRRPAGAPRSSARQRVLAAWRGPALPGGERVQPSRAQSAGAVMPRVLAGLRIESRQAEAEIAKVWNSLMDPNVVAHAQPVGLRKGTLFVVVDSSTWLSEIVRYRRKEILDRLQHSFGRDLIAKISYRIG